MLKQEELSKEERLTEIEENLGKIETLIGDLSEELRLDAAEFDKHEAALLASQHKHIKNHVFMILDYVRASAEHLRQIEV